MVYHYRVSIHAPANRERAALLALVPKFTISPSPVPGSSGLNQSGYRPLPVPAGETAAAHVYLASGGHPPSKIIDTILPYLAPGDLVHIWPEDAPDEVPRSAYFVRPKYSRTETAILQYIIMALIILAALIPVYIGLTTTG